MSRQILSYSDLDTSTTVTSKTVEVPNPNARHPEVQQMGPPKKKRKTNATHHRQTLMTKEMYQSTLAEALDDRAVQPHWDTAPTSDATVTLMYAENEAGPSNPPPEVRQPVGPHKPTPNPAQPIIGPQSVGAPIALRESFPVSRPQPSPHPQFTLPSTHSPAPVKPSQRSKSAKDKKGKRKASHPKGNASFPKSSRHLNHEEIWDDSALVDAWDAAMDQYRRMNGGKDWSAVPVKESPLWYNVPPEETDSESDVEGEQDIGSIEEMAPGAVEEVVQEDNIQAPTQWIAPTDVTGANYAPQVAPVQSVDISSLASLLPATTSGIPIRDYAFQKAKEASYALGYWTAIYELQSQKVTVPTTNTTVGVVSSSPESTDQPEGEDEVDESAFLPTQR